MYKGTNPNSSYYSASSGQQYPTSRKTGYYNTDTPVAPTTMNKRGPGGHHPT